MLRLWFATALTACGFYCGPDTSHVISYTIAEADADEAALIMRCRKGDCDPLCNAVLHTVHGIDETYYVVECTVGELPDGARVHVRYDNNYASCE